MKHWRRPDNPENGIANPEYPYAITTYRLTEHHVGGAMSRWLPWLSELQPELFAEISEELAAEKGVKNGDWITLWTKRGEGSCGLRMVMNKKIGIGLAGR